MRTEEEVKTLIWGLDKKWLLGQMGTKVDMCPVAAFPMVTLTLFKLSVNLTCITL